MSHPSQTGHHVFLLPSCCIGLSPLPLPLFSVCPWSSSTTAIISVPDFRYCPPRNRGLVCQFLSLFFSSINLREMEKEQSSCTGKKIISSLSASLLLFQPPSFKEGSEDSNLWILPFPSCVVRLRLTGLQINLETPYFSSKNVCYLYTSHLGLHNGFKLFV